MKIEQFHYGPNVPGYYKQTDGVSKLLPEDKIIELYNLGTQTRKPIEIVQLHQNIFGPPVITITFVEPTNDDKGRDTIVNKTFLVSLKDITDGLVEAVRPFSHSNADNVEPLKLDKFIVTPKLTHSKT